MSSLDMALEEVIKKTGNRGSGGRAAGGPRKAGNAGGGPRKQRAPKEEDEGDKGTQKERAKFAKSIAGGTFKALVKQATASAKSTATGKTPVAQGKSGIAAVSTSTPTMSRVATKGSTSTASTAAKLGMSLEDIVKTVPKGQAKNAKEGLAKTGPRMKLRKDGGNLKVNTRNGPKGDGKGKGAWGNSSPAKGKGKGNWWEPAWEPAWESKGKGKSSKGKGKGKDYDYDYGYDGYKGSGKGPSKGSGKWGPSWREEEDWEPPAKRSRLAAWEEPASFLRDRDEPRRERPAARSEMWGTAARAFGAAAPRREAPAWERVPDRERVVERRPAPKTESTGTRIRVTNVPVDLDRRDIKEAFEDRGHVTRCEVDRGVALVTFERAADAKKAVQTFDRGELNGQTIYVSVEA